MAVSAHIAYRRHPVRRKAHCHRLPARHGTRRILRFQRFHRVLNRANWSSLRASRLLLLALIKTFVPEGLLILALDDTIERRRGAKIAARGIYRDPVASTDKNVVKTSGLRWPCLMLVVLIPWANRY